MAYGDKVLDHYENPRNVGTLDKNDPNVGTGLVGAPACGDVMRLQVKISDDGKIQDAKFKTFGCGSAIASSSLVTEWVKGKSVDEAMTIKNTQIKAQLARRAQTNPQSGVRVGVKGGGCSGMSYVIEYCDQPRAKDALFEVEGAKIYVDRKSLVYLNGTTFDFVDTFQQKGFKFVNPQVKSECGCGESFSV